MATKFYIVETPVKDYCGIGAAGVHFANGKAEIPEGWALDWYKKHGYKVTEKAADISKMKVDELKAYAAENGIDLGEATKKEDILAVITNANN